VEEEEPAREGKNSRTGKVAVRSEEGLEETAGVRRGSKSH